MKSFLRWEKGTVGELTATGICMILMTILLLSYLDSMKLVEQKEQINQIAREYMLRMESAGELTAENRDRLLADLEKVGATGISLEGTTMSPPGYGNRIYLQMSGLLEGKYEFSEKRVSTAKY